jgi:hypothetical protein
MKFFSRLLIGVILSGLLFIPNQPLRVHAETSDFIESLPLVVNYPNSITFRGKLRESVKISDLKLVYSINRRECIDQIGFVQPRIAGNNSQEMGNIGDVVEWKWSLNNSGWLLGSVLLWSWVLESKSTEIKQETITDTRYKWHTAESQNITVYMTYEDEAVSKEILSIGEDTLKYLRFSLGSSPLPAVKYRIFVYPSNKIYSEVRSNPNSLGSFFNRSEATIRTGFSQSEWSEDPQYKATIAHEMTHAALADFEVFCDQNLPKWFTEGYARYIENVISPDAFTNKADSTIYLTYAQKNGVLSISEWSENSPKMGLYYSQSKYIFDYLIATYGNEKPQAVRLAISTTKDFDAAFADVYGFPVSELGPKFTEYMNRNLLVHQQIPPYKVAVDNKPQKTPIGIIPTIVPLTVRTGLNPQSTTMNYSSYLVMFAVVVFIIVVVLLVVRKFNPKNKKTESTGEDVVLHNQDTDLDEGVSKVEESGNPQPNSEEQQDENGAAR